MNGRLLTAAAIVIAVVSGVRGVQSQSNTEAEAALRSRVMAYYSTIKEKRFEETWRFLNAQMRRDTPQEEYARNLRTAQKDIQVVDDPKVELILTGDPNKPQPKPQTPPSQGRAMTHLKFVGLDGKVTDTVHFTYWRRQPEQSGAIDWFIDRDEMRELKGPTRY